MRRDVLLARVHPELFPVSLHEVRPPPRNVSRRRGRDRGRRARAIRVEPRVKLQPARMRTLDRERERVPEGLRRDALRAAQHLGPRLERGRIERVGGGPHLEDHRVRVQRREGVEKRDELLPLPGCRKSRCRRPVEVSDRRHPHASQLAARRASAPVHAAGLAAGAPRRPDERRRRCSASGEEHGCERRRTAKGSRGSQRLNASPHGAAPGLPPARRRKAAISGPLRRP